MGWAINKLRPFPTLNKKTRDYQTYPRYDSSQARRLIGWRATQTLQIETDDFEAAGKAIQLLQERLQVQGMRLSAKPESRKRALDALINEALDAFKQRARLVQRNMGSTGFRIIDLNIQTDRAMGPSYSDGVATAEIMRSAVVSEPAIEAGTSRVSVQVYGRIHLD
jgi:predicted secreted protein